MGKEIECRVRHEGKDAVVKALLETESVILRGESRAKIPFSSLSQVRAIEGKLHLDDTVLELGTQAEKWEQKILHPPTLLNKLGLKPEVRVALLGFSDRSFMEDRSFDTCLVEGEDYDVVLYHASDLPSLRGLQTIKHRLGAKTALWIVYPKGRKDITERQVFVHGKGIGLVDVKVCRFSDTLTALKFVRPRAG